MSFEACNALGAKREPFFFVVNFQADKIVALPLDALEANDIEYSFSGDFFNHQESLRKEPLVFCEYKKKFDYVQERIKAGETYLLNLTQPTSITTHLSLRELFGCANARYKLRYKEEFVCFSPEQFICIEGSKISTFPMKGTIDASIENAKERILGDAKEMAEHVMVVDLLRNDLSMVATDVRVECFRYVSEIEAGAKRLLQVSSHISGDIGGDWHGRIGDILRTLLPAGSISGAPKKSTLAIIDQVEGYERGFFSGVFGVYDGTTLQSAVMIRFIEKTPQGYIYKSGGGITLDSDALSEYQELLDKVYLP